MKKLALSVALALSIPNMAQAAAPPKVLEISLAGAADSGEKQEFSYTYNGKGGSISGYLLNGSFYIDRKDIAVFEFFPEVTLNNERQAATIKMSNGESIVFTRGFICKDGQCQAVSFYNGMDGGIGESQLMFRPVFEKAEYTVQYDPDQGTIRVSQ